MRTRISTPALLAFLAAIMPAPAYPPAPYYQIYGTVRDDHGCPLPTDAGTVILSGIYTARGTATVSGGAITGVTIVSGGGGFTSPPTVTFSGADGTGSGASGTAILTNGVVTGVTIAAGGTGYVAPVTVGISGGGAPAPDIVISPIASAIAPGVNYSLPVPMDSNTTAQLYHVSAMRPLLPFTIRVMIDGVAHVPMQIRGAPSDFWRNKIDSVNSPRIASTGIHWAVNQPAGKLRLDLWLGVDSNNDGLPDAWQWEVVYSDPTGRLTDFSEVDPNADFSGNGMTNMDKWLAGVYALEPSDGLNFQFDSIAGGFAKLRFQAITCRTYHIASSDDLATWTNPEPFSLTSDGHNPMSHYLAEEVGIVNIYVPADRRKFYKLYVD